jgi:hypothetical protein
MTKYLISMISAMVLGCLTLGLAQTEAESSNSLTVEAQLCTAIEDRMPTDTTNAFSEDVGTVYLWCRVTGAVGETTIKHVWYYDSKEMASVELPVRSACWRTYSSKKIPPYWSGNWTVKVLDADGNELTSLSFAAGKTEQ